MKKSIVLLLILYVSIPAFVSARQDAPVQLIIPEKSTEVKSKTNSGKYPQFHFSLNKAAFAEPSIFEPGSHFGFGFSDQQSKEYVITRRKEYFPGVISVIAKPEGEEGGIMSFTYSDGKLYGMVHDSHEYSYNFEYNRDEDTHVARHISEEKGALDCALDEESGNEFVSAQIPGSAAKSTGTSYLPDIKGITATTDDPIRLDLLIVYTDEVETWAADTSSYVSVQNLIAQAMLRAQTALDNSETGIDLELVHAAKLGYNDDESSVSASTHLRRLTQNPSNPINFCSSDDEGCDSNQWNGYMLQVHNLRRMHGADIVSLVVHISDTGGLGWRLSDPAGNYEFGFNLNRAQQIGFGYTLIHEIGHNMGNAHSRTQSTGKASLAGGLFHYSTGYQEMDKGYHTVMSYDFNTGTGGDSFDAPLFSSPDITFQGALAGSKDAVRPSDNARSMREIKRTIAYYEPVARVEPPVLSLNTSSIEIEMNQEDQFTETISLGNTMGESILIWDVDFKLNAQALKRTANKAVSGSGIKPREAKERVRSRFNLPPSWFGEGRAKISGQQEEVVYSTSFESSQGYNTGNYQGVTGWRSLYDVFFAISSEHPSDGSNHMRITYNQDANNIGSPYLGHLPFGSYEISMDISRSSVSTGDEQFQVVLSDGREEETTSGIIIYDNTVYVYYGDEIGEGTYFPTNGTLKIGEYQTLTIQHDAEKEVLRYYLDGVLLQSGDGGELSYAGGVTPDFLEIGYFGAPSGNYYDVDNVQVKQLEEAYSWLNLSASGGHVEAGESGSLELNFNTTGIPDGDYEAVLQLHTNDPENPLVEIPVTLSVREVVSNEKNPGLPEKISLAQNYPNPFNPATTLRYSLAQSEEVRLEVFNMQGQKVSTLVNQKQQAGRYEVVFDASTLASGVYMYRLTTPSQTLTRQMVLIK